MEACSVLRHENNERVFSPYWGAPKASTTFSDLINTVVRQCHYSFG